MVNSNLFNAISYNEYIGKIISVIANRSEKINQKSYRRFPTIQINQSYIAQIIDEYIKNGLFGQKFDPFVKNN
jgi:type III restriction enzyme